MGIYCEYTNNCTLLNEWTAWSINYISIKLLNSVQYIIVISSDKTDTELLRDKWNSGEHM